MGDRAHLRRQREVLYQLQGGRCYWCGVFMTLPVYPPEPGRRPPPNEATIDHLDSRYSPERGRHAGEYRRVAACVDCNGRRAAAEQAALPREEQWRRSGAYPQEVRRA